MACSREVVRMLFEQYGQTPLKDGGGKKGTSIFPGTLRATRTNAGFAAYGASRSGARSLAQASAERCSPGRFLSGWIFSRCVSYTKSQDILGVYIPRDVSGCYNTFEKENLHWRPEVVYMS